MTTTEGGEHEQAVCVQQCVAGFSNLCQLSVCGWPHPNGTVGERVPAGDPSLGGFLVSPEAPDEFKADADSQRGKFKVPTLRNVTLTAPYGHNGYFATLREMVVFKNTRETGDWPAADVGENITMEIGNLGLSDAEVDAVVAFLMTLTDN